MAAEQPFLQNESSGLPPACKPKLQQAGVYYLVWRSFEKNLSTHCHNMFLQFQILHLKFPSAEVANLWIKTGSWNRRVSKIGGFLGVTHNLFMM